MLQAYATKAGDTLHQGDGISGTGWNYYDNAYATDPYGPWAVGSGSEELNGTFDMMGNVWEWMENTWNDPGYAAGSSRALRGGSYGFGGTAQQASNRYGGFDPSTQPFHTGFRVAAVIPELGSATMLLAGAVGLLLWRRRRRAGP